MAPTGIDVPTSYETLKLTHLKISHHPSGTPKATPVVTFILDRAEKHNAFTPEMAESLTQAYQMIHLDPRVKVIVLTGAGRMFCAGSDLDVGFGSGEGRAVDFRDIGGRVALAMHRCHKPTVVALNGSAVGGWHDNDPASCCSVFIWMDVMDLSHSGVLICLTWTCRICHAKSKYGFVFTRRGLTIESCASYFLPRLVGFSRAMYLITTGGVYPPTSEHFGDLFTEVLPDAGESATARSRIGSRDCGEC
ncbi:Enoyl-CoA hydratase AKT3-1 [Penicillium verhagenii]|nr:Enoyl-CoA hydratase AKT3-1 [Penicillium verhagenii]